MKKSLSMCFCLLVIGLFTLSCGGGDDGGSAAPSGPTPPSQSITGTYHGRTGTTMLSDGQIFVKDPFVGIMVLGTNTIDFFITQDDGKTAHGIGTYTLTYTKGTTEAIMHVTENDETTNWQTEVFDLKITIDGFYYTQCSGWLPYDENLQYEQCVKWEKMSDSTELPKAKAVGEEIFKSSIKSIILKNKINQ